MSQAETTQVHTRLLKCSLEVEDARAYWQRTAVAGAAVTPAVAFDEYWFGARSLDTVKVLIGNFRARFAEFPAALTVLQRWPQMDPATRRVLCHWHLQLSDPLYRDFSGAYLVDRHAQLRPQVRRDGVITWVGEQGPGRWTMSTRIQFASKLLSAAFSAGLVTSNRDPRPLAFPPVSDAALTYMLYLLREVEFAGTLLDNRYFASVGLQGPELDGRLRGLGALRFRRQGELIEFGWCHRNLAEWAAAQLSAAPDARLGASS